MRISTSFLRQGVLLGILLFAVSGLTWLANANDTVIPWLPIEDVGPVINFGITQGLLMAGIVGAVSVLMLYFPRHQWLLAGLLIIGITPLALGGFWWSLGSWGISDWDYYFSYHESLRRTILEHHQFPLWNPYICGGTAGIGEPESPLLTPTFAFELLFGVPQGLRLAIFFSTSVGALGVLGLGRRIGLSALASLSAAIIFGFGSVNLLEIVEGHPNIFSAMWIPWIFWSWLGAYRHPHRLRFLLCGIFLALTFFQSGIYLLMYTGLAFALLPWLTRSPLRAYRTTLYAGLWALGLASIKLLPVLLWLRQFQDTAYASSAATIASLHHILLGRHLHTIAEIIPQQGGGWHEYGAYVGPLAVILALIGTITSWRHRIFRALFLTMLLAALVSSSGPLLKPFFDVAPYLPRSNISRFILFAVLPLALLAGTGIHYLNRRWRWLGPLLIVLVAADLLTLAYPLSQQAFILPAVVPSPQSAPYPLAHTIADHRLRVTGIDYTRAYASALAGYGTLTYCSTLGPPPAIQAMEAPENTDYLNPPPNGTAHLRAWSPNHFVVAVDTPTAGIVTINANYAEGWAVNQLPARNDNGRLAAPVTPGEQELVFVYRAPGFMTGVYVSTLTLLVALALVGQHLITRRQHHKVA